MEAEEGTISIVQAILHHNKQQQTKQSRSAIFDNKRKVLKSNFDYYVKEEIDDPDFVIHIMEKDKEDFDTQSYYEYEQTLQEVEEQQYWISQMEREREEYDQQAYQQYIQYHTF